MIINRLALLFLGAAMGAFSLSAGAAAVDVGGHLTPTQQRILAAKPREIPELEFGFQLPAGPQFTTEEMQRQLDAGRRVIPMVVAAFRSGADSVRIPPGDYRFGRETWGPDGPVHALEFSGLKRDAEHPFTLDATGATFWFDPGDDQAPTAHFCVGFKDCSHLVFKGATLDRGTRGNIEGRITQLDAANNRIEIQLSPGVVVPEKFNDRTEQRLLPFKADGRFCAPLYALQGGGRHLKYKSITPGGGAGRYYVTLADTALLDTIRDANWIRAYGDAGVLRVGDGLSCVYTVACALELVRSRNLTMEGITVYITKGWGAEWGGDGGHLWKNCYFGPRPGTSRWQGGEGFMFCATRHGTTLDNVTLVHTADDTANVHGYWDHIKGIAGNRVTFETRYEFSRTVLRDLAAGDRLLFHDKGTGQPLGNAMVTGIEGATVTLDKSANSFTNAIVEWPDHECAGWTVQNCHWHDNYQRFLIQSGPGTVRHCAFERQGSAIELNSVMPYVEGGVPRGITIAGNVFTDVNPMPHGAAITVHAHTFDRKGAPQFGGIAITANTFIRPGESAVALRGVTGGVISSNRIERPIEFTALARPDEPRRRQAIALSRCADIRVETNSLSDPENLTAPDVVTGSRLLGLDADCGRIVLDGRPVAAMKPGTE